MQFIKNLWKTQPNTVLGASAGFILLAFFGSISVYKSITSEPPKPRVLTPQEVVDEYEFQMRRVCKEQIQLKLDTPEPYKVQKIKFGMKRKYNQHQIAEIMRKREEGEGYGTIGRALGMSRSTVATIVKREKTEMVIL